MIKVEIDNLPLYMELDSGAAVSTISKKAFQHLWPHKYLEKISLKLQTYTGEILHPNGKAHVEVRYKKQTIRNQLYVLDQKVDWIFGRDWIRKIKVNILEINSMKTNREYMQG